MQKNRLEATVSMKQTKIQSDFLAYIAIKTETSQDVNWYANSYLWCKVDL
jgi:hypothetical protein